MVRFARRELVDIYLINRLHVGEIEIETETKRDLDKRNLEVSEYEDGMEESNDEDESDDTNFYDEINENPLKRFVKVTTLKILHTFSPWSESFDLPLKCNTALILI